MNACHMLACGALLFCHCVHIYVGSDGVQVMLDCVHIYVGSDGVQVMPDCVVPAEYGITP
jgi:hypothetical protein